MGRLYFAIKFSMTLFLLACHVGLGILFILSFAVHSGKSTEGIAIGVQAVLVVLISVRLWYYYAQRRRPVSKSDPLRAKRDVFDERIFVGSTCLISLAGAVWVTAHGFNLPDDFIGLPRPDVAAIVAITLVWLAWSISVHLVWIVVQEENPWLSQDREPEAIQWPRPSPPISLPRPLPSQTPQPQLPSTQRARGQFRIPGRRVSTKMVGAVQHGTPPEMWDHANPETRREKQLREQERQREREQKEKQPFLPALNPISPMPTYNQFEVQRARPRYSPSPRARPLCSPPPIKTSGQQWYVTPGEAF